MKFFPLVVVLGGCAWAPTVHEYPSGLRIVRLDTYALQQACNGDRWDDGSPRGNKPVAGCYVEAEDTIYIQNSCTGAEALPHELAHREKVAQPSAAGFDW